MSGQKKKDRLLMIWKDLNVNRFLDKHRYLNTDPSRRLLNELKSEAVFVNCLQLVGILSFSE